MLATIAVLAACLPLLPDRAGPPTLLTIAALAGVPPGLAFGALVLGLAASFEAGDFMGLIGIGGAVVWILCMVAAARAVSLPAGRGHPSTETFPGAAMALAALILLAGPALPVVVTAFAGPAQVDVMPSTAGPLGGGIISVATVQSNLPALTLFIPLLLVGAIAFGITGAFGGRGVRREPASTGSTPTRARAAASSPSPKSGLARPPVFSIPGIGMPRRLLDGVRAATVPEQYRTIVNPRALERAAQGRPLLWLATLVVLAYAVNR
jgi:hypothetical protein